LNLNEENMHTHRLIKCPECQKIIEQCRCVDLNKPVVLRVCAECQELKRVQEHRGGCRSCDD